MNKKYIVGGLIFWAGLSGYMGLRILESYTEDAVFAALSAVPAQAQEIRYSFLTNTLTLKGVEYELPDDTIMHKGSIERVDVTGFNRKCMFVKPDMPAYDPDTLPVVAESISASGITDRIHVGNVQAEQHISDVHIRGWYQRLGMFLDQHRQHNGEVSYYEELFRTRLDGMEVNNLTLTLTGPDMPPATVSVDKIALSEGLQAPRGSDRVSPVSLCLSGLRVSATDSTGMRLNGGMQRVDLEDVLLPDPEVIVEIVKTSRAIDEAASDTGDGAADSDAGMDAFEAQLEKMVVLMQKTYENRPPLSRFGMQAARFDVSEASSSSEKAGDDLVTVSLNSFNYMLSMTGAGEHKSATTLDGLQLNMAEFSNDEIMERYAPDGFVLNASGESVMSDTRLAGRGRYELKGLGVLEGDLEMLGDIKALQGWSAAENFAADPYALLQRLMIGSLNLKYEDSGLLAMGIELVARDDGTPPGMLLDLAAAELASIGQSQNRIVRQLVAALSEQMAMPGEFAMSLAPAEPVRIMDLAALVMMGSDELPVTFTSKPGTKPMKEYLPKN